MRPVTAPLFDVFDFTPYKFLIITIFVDQNFRYLEGEY